MTIKIHARGNDEVIKSVVLTGETTYEYAINHIYPLIDRFSAQRKMQDPSFYERLSRDILNKCLMPPITIAFVDSLDSDIGITDSERYVNSNINKGYVLDGIQRLNTLKRVSENANFPSSQKLFLTIIISSNKDMLLYRMITLNNGQKPMTPRHQIEVLTQELFDFKDLDIAIQTEKERSERIIRGAFNLGDISKAYLAFFTRNVHNENTKIISEKMDEILVGRILKSDITGSVIMFQDVLSQIDRFAQNEEAKTWLKVQNNLIGYCVGIHSSYNFLSSVSSDDFAEFVKNFDIAFKGVDAAKVNLGKFRRELSNIYISHIEDYSKLTANQLLEKFCELTAA